MKSFLSSVFSIILSAIGLIIKFLVFFPAFFILDFPFWLSLILAAIISSVPVFGSLINVVLWIWALIVCLNNPISTISIIFYILFALFALDLLQALIRTFRSK